MDDESLPLTKTKMMFTHWDKELMPHDFEQYQMSKTHANKFATSLEKSASYLACWDILLQWQEKKFFTLYKLLLII